MDAAPETPRELGSVARDLTFRMARLEPPVLTLFDDAELPPHMRTLAPSAASRATACEMARAAGGCVIAGEVVTQNAFEEQQRLHQFDRQQRGEEEDDGELVAVHSLDELRALLPSDHSFADGALEQAFSVLDSGVHIRSRSPQEVVLQLVTLADQL